jgi:hypothetical protein
MHADLSNYPQWCEILRARLQPLAFQSAVSTAHWLPTAFGVA